jgi:hypothetical protein
MAWKRAPSAPYKTDVIEGQPKRGGCAEGTREDVLEHICEWAINGSSPPMFWLRGMAGEGKSTIAFTICEFFDEDNKNPKKPRDVSLGASFCCSRQVESLRRRQNIVPMLAYQLAHHSRSFATALDGADLDAIDTSNKQVEKLLVTPWNASVEERPPSLPLTLVVIDALDEIEDDGGEKLLKELIQATQVMAQDGAHGLKILVTSRPHPSIVNATKSLPVYRLEDINAEDGRKDILTYLRSALPCIAVSGQDTIYDTIADHARGLFIYAATIVRVLSGQTQKEQKRTLAIILGNSQQAAHSPNPPMAIDTLYMQVLAANLEDRYISRLVVLHCIICALQPMPVSTIAQVAAGAAEDDLDEEATRRLVEGLHSVLYISDKDGCVYIYHKSFSDFLLDGNRSDQKYTCNAKLLHSTISMACFRIMQSSLHFNMCNLPSSYLFDSEVQGLDQSIKTNIVDVGALEYACRYWTSHLVQVPVDSKDSQPLRYRLLEFSREKILYWFEVMNVLGAKAECYAGVNAVMGWVNKQVGTLLSMTLS